jgi:hypothetical protein
MAVLMLLATTVFAQQPVRGGTPFFTSFYDSTNSSTINGELLPIGTVIEAYDPDGVLCGADTVSDPPGIGTFGFMPVYGDDPDSPGVDEGAEAGDTITFKVNHRTATVTHGNPVWADDKLQRNLGLSVVATLAISEVDAPSSALIAPGDTIDLQIEVRNDGDGLDFYGIKFSMTLTEGTDTMNAWQAIPPGYPVYADSGAAAFVPFKVRAPIWGTDDTVNTVTWTVYSLIDTTIKVTGVVDVYRTITDVDENGNLMPKSFALFQNYPNPFNPTTTISFELRALSQVRLEVIDILGRTVEERDLGMLPGGVHAVEYDASRLASGVYFYRVSTESGVQTRKMSLIK